MSKALDLDRDVPRSGAEAARAEWPEGATAGLLMVAAACLAFMLLIYRIAGPSDVFVH